MNAELARDARGYADAIDADRGYRSGVTYTLREMADALDRASEVREEVYLVVGWFGDQEWLEGVYATEELASAVCNTLWKTRTSEQGPAYAQRLHKFAVQPEPVCTKLPAQL